MRFWRLSEVLAERRRSPRRQAQYLRVVYWNGSEAVVRRLREVNTYGAFVETLDRWYPGTIMQMQFVAELPLPGGPPEMAPQAIPPPASLAAGENGIAGPESEEHMDIAESGTDSDAQTDELEGELAEDGHHHPAESPPPTETVSIPLMSKVVRRLDDGICVEFIFQDGKQHRALANLLRAVEERTRTIEARSIQKA